MSNRPFYTKKAKLNVLGWMMKTSIGLRVTLLGRAADYVIIVLGLLALCGIVISS